MFSNTPSCVSINYAWRVAEHTMVCFHPKGVFWVCFVTHLVFFKGVQYKVCKNMVCFGTHLGVFSYIPWCVF